MVAQHRQSVGWDLAFARVVLAGIFLFAAYQKLIDTQSFAQAIKAFEIVHDRTAMEWIAFIIPWIECVCGVALLLGVWARAAALVLFVLLLAFIGGLVSVIARGMEIDCQCFGDYFGSTVSWTSIARDIVFMAIAAPIIVRGAGMLSIDDALGRRKAARRTEPQREDASPEPTA